MMAAMMTGVVLVARRELRAYFDSPIAYITAAAFLVLAGTSFMNSFFLQGVIDMTPFFDTLPFLLIPFIPALTMRTWSEEHAQGTVELLLTLPLQPLQVVLGKYGAALLYYGLILAGSLPIVAMLAWLGAPDLGLIFCGYLGALLLGALFLAFGQFLSSLTHNQIVAFALAALLASGLVFSGHPQVVEVMDGLWPAWQPGTVVAEALSCLPQYEAFVSGLIGLDHILYFVLMSVLFLWLTQVGLRRIQY
ncbi:MAG: ABC transporter permease [Gemmatimonadaceae bacterium]|jgi:ABC-2 type transport system permease protein|nr:ABC transporter permease [Gemmatimonadaceae bacterium]